MSDDDQLADLLVAYEDALERGVPMTPEEACRERRDLLPKFRDLLGDVGDLHSLFAGREPADDTPQVDASDRFKPLSFHAGGGLGAVYVAEDSQLGRTVAMKTMQRLPALDSVARQRFLMEAEITGRLDHPGVVPVYGLGRDRQGRPYYTMRFIRGQTLGEAVKKFHATKRPADDPKRNVEFRSLLSRYVSVCQTVAYAHVRGVIHRDIKPGNIMLGPFGETLLVDWGLAKSVTVGDPEATVDHGSEPIAASGGGVTQAGVAKGSPAFMSPEQARGDDVGPPSDVYGLGATLFVLLTGQPPYSGTATEVIRRVAAAATSPSARKVAASVPAALDAVCLKAMAPKPEDRYATAQDFAADIERWLADEPVSVWREPFPIRARRWVSRHRLAVSSGAAAIFVATVLLAILGVVLDSKNRALAASNTALVHANEAERRAKADLEQRNRDLVAANDAERKARADAEQHLKRNLKQLYAVLGYFQNPKQAAALRTDPDLLVLFQELENHFAALSSDAPDNREARQAITLVRLLRISNDPSKVLTPDLVQRVTALRADVDRSIEPTKRSNFDLWCSAELHNAYAQRLIVDHQFAEARKELDAAYKLFSEHAVPDSDACRGALAAVALTRSTLWDKEGRPPTDRMAVLARIDHALAEVRLIKRLFSNSEFAAWMGREILQQPKTIDDSLAQLKVLVALYSSRGEIYESQGEMEKAIANYRIALSEIATAPREIAEHQSMHGPAAGLRIKWAGIEYQRDQYREAWEVINPALDHLAMISPNSALESDRLAKQFEVLAGMIAIAYLQTLDPAKAEDRATAATVLSNALTALRRWRADQERLPADIRYPALLPTAEQFFKDLETQQRRFAIKP